VTWYPPFRLRRDPGPCPVDDAPHTTCTSHDAGPIVIQQTPMRDLTVAPLAPAPAIAPATFTTATYRRKEKR